MCVYLFVIIIMLGFLKESYDVSDMIDIYKYLKFVLSKFLLWKIFFFNLIFNSFF